MPQPRAYPTLPDSDHIEAIIWDWDGTLVHSGEINFQALRQSLLRFGLVLTAQWYDQRASMTTRELLVEWQAEHGPLPVPVKTITSFCGDYVIEHAVDLVVIEELAEIARRAHAVGWRQAIASNASTRALAAGLQATRLAPLFEVTVTGSDVGRGKPAPDVFLLAAQRLGVDPAACLVYEDSPQGLAGAIAAGMRVVDVREGVAVPAGLHCR
jgi:HAD superfamily hydrolase (TIGR01509 family)